MARRACHDWAAYIALKLLAFGGQNLSQDYPAYETKYEASRRTAVVEQRKVVSVSPFDGSVRKRANLPVRLNRHAPDSSPGWVLMPTPCRVLTVHVVAKVSIHALFCGRSAQPRQIVRSVDDLDPSYISADFLLVDFVAAEFTDLSLLSVVQSHLPRASSSRMPPGVMRLPAGLTGCAKQLDSCGLTQDKSTDLLGAGAGATEGGRNELLSSFVRRAVFKTQLISCE
ncbi:uncharacterized protein BO88DRAFT_423170 [Aspergillus vadensis CBS 113365]|uniref:Uncharacterized protein n=1 Tax=Aspergillus vadensis (strain CBS 113365 / IMI 142717 / IBT 24658) TaxID=1448311 RepID=A0A319C2A2_ASPVC|nr:hypothetical protein BO88DRAFT_423170 [Aspergillus vadensis CBS 113365]PYH72353.1 hypothetical protein BO88DRAFT_423170 [Aspergillus vadensis CBS 113365]